MPTLRNEFCARFLQIFSIAVRTMRIGWAIVGMQIGAPVFQIGDYSRDDFSIDETNGNQNLEEKSFSMCGDPRCTHGIIPPLEFTSKSKGIDCSFQLRSRQDKFIFPIRLGGLHRFRLS